MFGLISNYQRLDVFMLGNNTLEIHVITGALLVSRTCDCRNLHGYIQSIDNLLASPEHNKKAGHS